MEIQCDILFMIYDYRMAENKDNAENSSSGSVTLKTMIRKFSLRKKKEKEVATPDGPNSNTKPRSPDTQSKTHSPNSHFLLSLLKNSTK